MVNTRQDISEPRSRRLKDDWAIFRDLSNEEVAELESVILERSPGREKDFDDFCQGVQIVSVTGGVLNRAADFWVIGRKGGHPHRGADLIIAATSLESPPLARFELCY